MYGLSLHVCRKLNQVQCLCCASVHAKSVFLGSLVWRMKGGQMNWEMNVVNKREKCSEHSPRCDAFMTKHLSLSALFIFTILFYAVSIAAVVLLYVYYTKADGCAVNKGLISVNLILCVVVSVVSVLPKIQVRGYQGATSILKVSFVCCCVGILGSPQTF